MGISQALNQYREKLKEHALPILLAFFFVVLSFGFICGSNTISLKVFSDFPGEGVEVHLVYDDPYARDKVNTYSFSIIYYDAKGIPNEQEIHNELFTLNPKYSLEKYDIVTINLNPGIYEIEGFQLKGDTLLYLQEKPNHVSVPDIGDGPVIIDISLLRITPDDADLNEEEHNEEGVGNVNLQLTAYSLQLTAYSL